MSDTEYGMIEEMLPILVSKGKGKFTPEEIERASKFKKFIDHLPGGFLIYRANESEEIIYANDALIRMFECADAEEFMEFTGNSFKGLVYSEDYDDVAKSIEQQVEANSDKLDYVEYRILTKKGNMKYVEDYGHYIPTRVGDMYYVFITDSTSRTAKRKKENTQWLEVIEGLSVNYDSIMYIDLETDTATPYRMSKRLGKQFDGKMKPKSFTWVVEEFVKTWVHPEDRDAVLSVLAPDHIREELENDRSFHTNFRCLFDGELQLVQMTLVDVKNNGHISQVVLGSRRIEDEIQQELQQKTLLANALKDAKMAYVAKNTFLSNISHDMRTPLNALFGYLELAKKHVDDRETLLKHLDNVGMAGRQLLDLVGKVLDISYLESKDYELKEELNGIDEVTKDVYDELAPQAKKKKLNFTLEQVGITHHKVYLDSEQLKKVLLNLVTNAVRYTAAGGKVNFTVKEIPSSSLEFASFQFVVQDNGIGIAQESLEKIFEPFEREANYTQSGIYGSGLGLTLAKQIIEGMGGTITAESQVGVGSTFTVNLSFRLSEAEEAESDTQDVEDFIKGKKILVVEDNEINLEIETELLEDLGLIVDTAENGKIAVEKVASSQPYEYLFVLMDIQMPVMDGWQATEEIRRLDNPALSDIPIIALSANAFESDKRLSAKNGMNAHMNKPIDIGALLLTVRKTVMKRPSNF